MGIGIVSTEELAAAYVMVLLLSHKQGEYFNQSLCCDIYRPPTEWRSLCFQSYQSYQSVYRGDTHMTIIRDALYLTVRGPSHQP